MVYANCARYWMESCSIVFCSFHSSCIKMCVCFCVYAKCIFNKSILFISFSWAEHHSAVITFASENKLQLYNTNELKNKIIYSEISFFLCFCCCCSATISWFFREYFFFVFLSICNRALAHSFHAYSITLCLDYSHSTVLIVIRWCCFFSFDASYKQKDCSYQFLRACLLNWN